MPGVLRTAALSVSLGLLAGTGVGCLLNLDPGISCGDGYVDADAGEECDPDVPSSYQNACAGTSWPMGTASCDPLDCQIRNSPQDCAACGDGKLDPGEECDDAKQVLDLCLEGTANVRCEGCQLRYDLCPACGNGVLNDGEQCDFKTPGDIIAPVACKGLPSPISKDYTHGTAEDCRSDCTYDQRKCSFCDDGVLDGAINLGNGVITLPEVCDDSFPRKVDSDTLEKHCRKECTGSDVGDIILGCEYECATNCQTLQPVPTPDLACCLPRDEPCPLEADPEFPCCATEEGATSQNCDQRFGKVGLGPYCN